MIDFIREPAKVKVLKKSDLPGTLSNEYYVSLMVQKFEIIKYGHAYVRLEYLKIDTSGSNAD